MCGLEEKYAGFTKGDWKTYPIEFFFERLKECAQPRDQDDPLEIARKAIDKVRLHPGDYSSPDAVAKYIKVDSLSAAGVYKRGENEHRMSDEKQSAFVKDLFNKLPTTTDNKFKDKVRLFCNNGKFTTLDDYLDAVNEIFNDFIMARNKAVEQGYDLEPLSVRNQSQDDSGGKTLNQPSKRKTFRAREWQANKSLKEDKGEELESDDSMRKSSKVSKDSAKSESQNKRRSCDGCGGANHKKADCRLKKHPGFNESSVKWEENTKAKGYLRNCKSEKSIIASFLLKKKFDWDPS